MTRKEYFNLRLKEEYPKETIKETLNDVLEINGYQRVEEKKL